MKADDILEPITSQGIPTAVGPPMAYVEIDMSVKKDELVIQRFVYEVLAGRGATEAEARADYAKKLENRLLVGDVAAIIWRHPPTVETERDYEHRKDIWQVYSMAAFLSEARLLENVRETTHEA